jgi:uncharacterized protein
VRDLTAARVRHEHLALERLPKISAKPTEAHVCARCPKALGGSCCEVRDEERLATLTHADVDRIREHTRRSPATFTSRDWLSIEDAGDYEARRPLYRGYFRSGPERLTLARANGACVFLDRSSGCVLPSDVRPVACRVYPFELLAHGEWGVQVGRFGELEAARASAGDACLAVEEANSFDALLQAFGMTLELLESLASQLSSESAEHGVRSSRGRSPADRPVGGRWRP